MQRLVPTLGASSYWAGTVPGDASSWRDDRPLAIVVDKAASRDTPVPAGIQLLSAFVAGLPPEQQERAVALAFAGLVQMVNQERSAVIERIEVLTRRQREIAAAAAVSTEELSTLPADANPAQRDEIVQRRALLVRQFDDLARTMRYACDVPVQLEVRLGAYARALQEPVKP